MSVSRSTAAATACRSVNSGGLVGRLVLHEDSSATEEERFHFRQTNRHYHHAEFDLLIEDKHRPLPTTPGIAAISVCCNIFLHNWRIEWCPAGVERTGTQPQSTSDMLFPGGLRLVHLDDEPLKLRVVGSSYPIPNFNSSRWITFEKGTHVSFGCRPPTGNTVTVGFHLLREGGTNPRAIYLPENKTSEFLLDLCNHKTSLVPYDCKIDVREKEEDPPRIIKFCSTLVRLHSPEFMSSNSLPKSDGSPVMVTGFHPKVVEAALAYMHDNNPTREILEEHSLGIIKFADKFDMPALKVHSENYFAQNTRLHIDNVFDLLSISLQYTLPYLEEVVLLHLIEMDPPTKREYWEKLNAIIHTDGFDPRFATLILRATSLMGNFNPVHHNFVHRWEDAGINTIRWELRRRGASVRDIDGTREMLVKKLEEIAPPLVVSLVPSEGGTGDSDSSQSYDSDMSVASEGIQ